MLSPRLLAIPASLLLFLTNAAVSITPPQNQTTVSKDIKLDQAGYLPDNSRIALVAMHAGTNQEHQDFMARRAEDSSIAFHGKLQAPVIDADAGDQIEAADFSQLIEPGRYFLDIPGVGKSWRFAIRSDVFDRVYYLAMRSYYGQRCGTAVDLGSEFPGFRHGECHLQGDYHPSSGKQGAHVSSHGWHDAGDYGRYVVNSGISTATLLWTSELFGKRVNNISLHIPESGNSAPDTLNEDKPFDAQYAERCLRAAKSAWVWLEGHPDIIFRNPVGIATGEYRDQDCRDEYLWAAAELARTSGDENFNRYFIDHYKAFLPSLRDDKPPSWANVGSLALWTYGLARRGDAQAVKEIQERSLAAADGIAKRATRPGYNPAMTTKDYIWGSNGVAANYGMQLLIADVLKPNPAYREAAMNTLHYILGRNTQSLSFVTQVGENAFTHPHHRPSAADGIDAPWPGLLSGGPNAGRQDPEMKRSVPAGLPPAKSYIDATAAYACNEVAINWNAPFVFVLAGTQRSSEF